ncbi:MAG: hypothetical protein J2P43_13980 [Candidatus Dormibacteraeota bacterium]|nr:hypothetical protein [Candidatus Dormibacteraeota bacterium]
MDGVRGLGRAVFAAVLLMIGGVLNIIWGIAAISNSSFFVHNTQYIFSNLKGWGWITLIIGILEILASVSLFAGGTYGRWFAIVVGSIAAIDALLNIPAYPFWSLAVFALSLWIIHGLLVYGDSEPLGSVSQGPARTTGPPPPM